jgi:putative YphP/YqiW family bacilliredoxin
MDINMFMPMVQHMRDELTRVGFQELKTPEEVEKALPNAKGTTVVFVNSVCGCAGGIARPGAALGLQHVKPDNLFTVFAGQDKDATTAARGHFAPYPPSSPSIAIMKDGKLVTLIERSQIEGSSPEAVAAKLAGAVEAAKNA